MKITVFDNGQQEEELINIYPEDQVWFEEHNAKLSVESLNENLIFYADIGFRVNNDEAEDPEEVIAIDFKHDMIETLKELKNLSIQTLHFKKELGIEPFTWGK